jgi:hypothetical protein
MGRGVDRQVTRTYTFTVSGWWNNWHREMSHIQEKGMYNDELFQDFDRLLALANQYKVRSPPMQALARGRRIMANG